MDTASQSDNKDSIVIPKSTPSWYDTVNENGGGPESSRSCTFITNETGTSDETESAVNCIKYEIGESENASRYVLDEEINAIDFVKEELVVP